MKKFPARPFFDHPAREARPFPHAGITQIGEMEV
jgi:hypothetical protein